MRHTAQITLAAVAAVAVTMATAACGSSGGPPRRASATGALTGVRYAECMRAHGVPSFPDPGAGGLVLPASINQSAPAFRTAQTACRALLPVKHVPSPPPTAQAYARLLHWARCMRAHAISGLPDPRPDPPPGPGSPGTAGIGTLMGDGGYWVAIPATVDAHSPAFMRLATACGESPGRSS